MLEVQGALSTVEKKVTIPGHGPGDGGGRGPEGRLGLSLQGLRGP